MEAHSVEVFLVGKVFFCGRFGGLLWLIRHSIDLFCGWGSVAELSLLLLVVLPFFVSFFLLQGFALKGASATNGERLTLTDKERGIIWEAMTPPSPAKKKRRTSLPLPPDRQSQAPATFKKSARLPTNASLAAAAAAKKKNDATQIAIAFESKTKYPVGMKILLSDKIYSSPGQVSRRNSSVAFRILIPFPHVLVLLFSLPGTRAGTWSPV